MTSGFVGLLVLFGEENDSSPSKCSVEVDIEVVDPLRSKELGCSVVEGNEHISSQEIHEEAPTSAQVDETANLRVDDVSKDEEVRHVDVDVHFPC